MLLKISQWEEVSTKNKNEADMMGKDNSIQKYFSKAYDNPVSDLG